MNLDTRHQIKHGLQLGHRQQHGSLPTNDDSNTFKSTCIGRRVVRGQLKIPGKIEGARHVPTDRFLRLFQIDFGGA
jgi:hypothetical protein